MLHNKLIQGWVVPPSWLRFLLAVLLALGIFFRFANLDHKIYWIDETFTSLRISGYTEAELVQHLSDEKITDIKSLENFQRPNPEKGWIDTIKSLALEDPQHPPLYYLIARFWTQGFGNSVAVMRSLPALISLFAFPCIYWLCLELFELPLAGWVAVALIAVSPFHILYAQEARQYSLWTVTILLSSAALLRAMRLKTPLSWGLYGVTLVASLYTFLFSGLVAIGHGIYVIALEKSRLTKTLKAYLITSALSLFVFIPWVLVVVANRPKTQSVVNWTSNERLSLPSLFLTWISNLKLVFFDFNTTSADTLLTRLVIKILELLLLIFVSYSFYFLCRQSSKRIWLFILTLTGVTALVLMVPDLVMGGWRSTIPRYAIPSYLGIQLTVVYLLATQISGIAIKAQQQKFWQIVTLLLISFGIISCAVSTRSQVWWNKTLGQNLPDVARILNQEKSPLLIGSPTGSDLLALSYLVQPQKLQLFVTEPQCITCTLTYQSGDKFFISEIPDDFSEVFLFKAGAYEKWLKQFDKEPNYKLEPVVSKSNEVLLWRVEKQS